MKRPTPPPDDLDNVVALCLELYERRGPQAVDAELSNRPGYSDLVRERLDALGSLGLVGDAPKEAMPARIGGYRVIRLLGRGGMGVVYEAEQDSPTRRVALKVMRSWPSGNARIRFQHEAELLARLQHPGLAQIYEVGSAVVGGMTVPFFAMELVRGEPLDRHVREHRLDLRDRLELIAKVGDAVHHAHQKGIVHRDLKPANVLVDERGDPRVLDFGVARAIDPDLELETMRTEVGQLVGTLSYMSPEQAAGESTEIDSRSDVYSLGVVAFELLSGRLPHATEGRSLLDVMQSIRDDEVPLLGGLDRALRGDVETIVAKALSKEKERRYASAHELASDIRRCLSHEPIAARPATVTYQLAKFARRRRGLVVGAAAVVMALVLGLAGTVHGLLRAEREREDAERRLRQSSAVLDFQSRMFATADPTGEGIQVEDMLDRAVLMVANASEDPVEEAAFRSMLGRAYAGLGLWEKAEPFLAAAIEVFDRELGSSDLQALEARTRLAGLLGQVGRFEDAERLLEGLIERARRTRGEDHDSVLGARLVHASLLKETGDYAGAVAIAREVEAAAEPADRRWYQAQRMIAVSSDLMGDLESAVAAARAAYDLHIEAHGEEHPGSLTAMETLGTVLLNGELSEAARPILERELELRRELLGAEHPDTLRSMANTGAVYLRLYELDRAERVLREAVALAARRLPPGHPTIMHAGNNLGAVLLRLGQVEEAEALFRDAVDMETETRGPEHPNTLTAMANLAYVLESVNRLDEAREIVAIVLDIRRDVQGDRHPGTLGALNQLAGLYALLGDHEAAYPLNLELAHSTREVFGGHDSRGGLFLVGPGLNLASLGRHEEAEPILLEAGDILDRTLPADHPERRKQLIRMEGFYIRWGKLDEAAEYTALLTDR